MTIRPRRFRFIVHEDRAGKPEIDELVDLAESRGISAELCIARAEGDGARLAREGAAVARDAVVAVGGDGTVNEVVNGLAGSAIPLGIVPLGTANDFAQQFGIPDDPSGAVELFDSELIVIDTASLNGRRFINVSTAGIGAEMSSETSDELKELLGPFAYAVTGIRKLVNLEPMQLEIAAPGMEFGCEALVLAVGNARATGGGNVLTPSASVVDGLIDVCIVEAMPVASFLPLLLKLRGGDHLGEDGVRYFRVPDVTIEAQQAVSVNVDGEPMTATRLEYRAHPADLRVYLGRRPPSPAAFPTGTRIQ